MKANTALIEVKLLDRPVNVFVTITPIDDDEPEIDMSFCTGNKLLDEILTTDKTYREPIREKVFGKLKFLGYI